MAHFVQNLKVFKGSWTYVILQCLKIKENWQHLAIVDIFFRPPVKPLGGGYWVFSIGVYLILWCPISVQSLVPGSLKKDIIVSHNTVCENKSEDCKIHAGNQHLLLVMPNLILMNFYIRNASIMLLREIQSCFKYAIQWTGIAARKLWYIHGTSAE